MKTYCLPLESNGRDCGFLKSALYALEKGDKSTFSMSGHVNPLEVQHIHESDLEVARESWDLPRQTLLAIP